MKLMFIILIVFAHIFIIQHVNARTFINNSRTAINYLTQYGYVDPDLPIQSRTGMVDMKNFLTKFQSFFHLKVTGLLDPETIKLMNKPRCGVPDFFPSKHTVERRSAALKRVRRYKLHGSSWPSNRVTWRISKYSQRADIAGKSREIQKIFKAAFNTWAEASQLEFESVRDARSVDIDIRFEVGNHNDTSNFDGRGGTLAHAFFPKYGGDAHFDDDEDWVLTNSAGTHLQTVALHELGHSLGLSHSDVKGAVMYPTYEGVHVDLSDDDRQAIQKLYGAPQTHRTSTTTTTTARPPVSTSGHSAAAGLCSDFQLDAAFCAAAHDCYFISGSSIFRLLPRGGVHEGYPKPVSQVLYGVRGKVDSVLKYDGHLYVIQGDVATKFPNVNSYPTKLLRLSELFPGLPIKTFDVAYEKDFTKNVYIFKGDKYWRYHKNVGFYPNYPKSVAGWGLSPGKLDAVVDFDDETTYFIKGDQYWSFDEITNKMKDGYPKNMKTYWLGCKKNRRRSSNRSAVGDRGTRTNRSNRSDTNNRGNTRSTGRSPTRSAGRSASRSTGNSGTGRNNGRTRKANRASRNSPSIRSSNRSSVRSAAGREVAPKNSRNKKLTRRAVPKNKRNAKKRSR